MWTSRRANVARVFVCWSAACAATDSSSRFDSLPEQLNAERRSGSDAPAKAEAPDEIKREIVPVVQTLPSPDVMASQAPDQRACLQQINAIVESHRDPELAFKLLIACVERGKITSIELLFEDRFRPFYIKLDPLDQARLGSKLIASRGGKLKGDLPILQSNGLKLEALEPALEDPSAYKGKLLIVRALVADHSRKGLAHRFELDESSERAIDHFERSYATNQGVDHLGRKVSVDRYGRSFARSRSTGVSMPTGLTLSGDAPMEIKGVETDGEYLFLVRFQSRRPPEDDLDDRQHANVEILGVFKLAVDALPLRR